jgi:hypothetical protein
LSLHSNTLYIYEPSNYIRYWIWAITIASSFAVFLLKPWTGPKDRQRFLSRLFIFLVPIGLGIACTHMLSRLDVIGTYKLGIENPGVRIEKVREANSPCQGGDFCPHLSQFIYIDRGWKAYPVTSMSEFKGLVTISTTEQALTFVRLRNVPTVWPAGHDMWEATFTLKPDDAVAELVDSKSPTEMTAVGGSGSLAVLSDKAYKLGRFTQTTVQAVGLDFVVTRWVAFRNDDQPLGVVELWREYVGRDGSYRLVTLKAEALPDLPDTRWSLWWQGRLGPTII